MHFNKSSFKSSFVLTLLLVFSAPASAGQFFVGLDATSLSPRVQFDNSNDTYTFNYPLRLKFGYFWNWAGLEFNVLSPDDATKNVLGAPTTVKVDTSYGVYLALQEDWLYGRLGVTWLDTTFTRTAVDSYEVIAPTVSFGIQHNFGKHYRMNLGYTYMEGTTSYPNNTVGSGSDPIFNYSGFEFGFNVLF